VLEKAGIKHLASQPCTCKTTEQRPRTAHHEGMRFSLNQREPQRAHPTAGPNL